MDKVIVVPNSPDKEVKVELSRKAACQSKLMDDMLAEDNGEDGIPEIPLPDVTPEIFEMVAEFLRKHENDPMKEIVKPISTNVLKDIVGDWDANYMTVLDQDTLFKVILAANYLDIPSLLDLGICALACMVKGKEPDEVKKLFNIEPDITPEEEKLVRDSNPWIFEVSMPAEPPAVVQAAAAAAAN